ncbi:glycosyltransferase family 4 protein [Paenibacillus sp. PAMC21692]|nr:glycosyltransferase family 4 protein [Paenibacillus sp. PAMC21692]
MADAGERRPKRVWMWPRTSGLNVYNNLLTEALMDAGLDVRDLSHGKLMLKIGKARRGDVVHVHWFHHAYWHRNPVVSALKSTILILTLTYMRLRGINLVWTIHNLYPHDSGRGGAERLMRRLICRFSTGLIVASESIKRKVKEEFGVPERKLHVVKHGHYLDVYKPQGLRVRELYGIGDDDDVFLFMGTIKPYKGVDDLVEAFRMVRTERTHLIIAGKADAELELYLQGLRREEGVILMPGFIPNEEVADLLNAADALVLPYKEITTSGSAILGLTFKKLVVMPDNEFIDDYFQEHMAIRYDPSFAGGLASALEEARMLKRQRKAPDYEEALRELDWDVIARKTELVYAGRG